MVPMRPVRWAAALCLLCAAVAQSQQRRPTTVAMDKDEAACRLLTVTPMQQSDCTEEPHYETAGGRPCAPHHCKAAALPASTRGAPCERAMHAGVTWPQYCGTLCDSVGGGAPLYGRSLCYTQAAAPAELYACCCVPDATCRYVGTTAAADTSGPTTTGTTTTTRTQSSSGTASAATTAGSGTGHSRSAAGTGGTVPVRPTAVSGRRNATRHSAANTDEAADFTTAAISIAAALLLCCALCLGAVLAWRMWLAMRRRSAQRSIGRQLEQQRRNTNYTHTVVGVGMLLHTSPNQPGQIYANGSRSARPAPPQSDETAGGQSMRTEQTSRFSTRAEPSAALDADGGDGDGDVPQPDGEHVELPRVHPMAGNEHTAASGSGTHAQWSSAPWAQFDITGRRRRHGNVRKAARKSEPAHYSDRMMKRVNRMSRHAE